MVGADGPKELGDEPSQVLAHIYDSGGSPLEQARLYLALEADAGLMLNLYQYISTSIFLIHAKSQKLAPRAASMLVSTPALQAEIY